jgi:hypothetical protein
VSTTEKGNGKTAERRSGVDRRIHFDPEFVGPERREKGPRRSDDRAPDKPIKR